MFIKYNCDCVGIELGDGSKFTVQTCDREWHEDNIMINKGIRPCINKPNIMSPDEEKYYLVEMGELIKDGYKYRKIKQLLE